MDPAGKTAVVTGGNSGLGEAAARALLAAGAQVVTLDVAGTPPEGARSVHRSNSEGQGGVHRLGFLALGLESALRSARRGKKIGGRKRHALELRGIGHAYQRRQVARQESTDVCLSR